MRVSVITPSFNQGNFLDETIRSVLGQCYEDVEYLVIDGGSTDESLAVIERNRQKLAYATSAPDAGQSNAVNKGLAIASGEIIGWLNSDDCYLPGAIRAAVEEFDKHPDASVVYGDYVKIDDSSRIMAIRRQPPFDYRICLFSYITVPQPAAFIRRAALDSIGGLDESLHYAMDQDLWLRLARVGTIRHIARYQAAFRIHRLSKSVSRRRESIDEVWQLRRRYTGLSQPALKLMCLAYKLKTAERLIMAGCIPSRFGRDKMAPSVEELCNAKAVWSVNNHL